MNEEEYEKLVRNFRMSSLKRVAIILPLSFAAGMGMLMSEHRVWFHVAEAALILTGVGFSIYANILGKRAHNLATETAHLAETIRLGHASIQDYGAMFARHKVEVPEPLKQFISQQAKIAPSESTHT